MKEKKNNLGRWYYAGMPTYNDFACKFQTCSLNTSKSPIAVFEKYIDLYRWQSATYL